MTSADTDVSPQHNYRFRVPDGEVIDFTDLHAGAQAFTTGCDSTADFGDFLVWRKDGLPSYQLACVVDDAFMGITEVVRGRDLLKSTARQILLQRALSLPTPTYYHCDLMRDTAGTRLAKRHDALSLRALRESGLTPDQIRARF
jgi:glutamyl-tRNA synthetase